MKKYILLSIIAISLYVLYKIFVSEIRMFKEVYLIKANFHNNENYFNLAFRDFEEFPDISLSFAENDYIDLNTKSFVLYNPKFKPNIDSLYENDLMPFISIDDSTAELFYESYNYSVENIKFIDSTLQVSTTNNQIFDFGKIWTVSYTGFGTSKFIPVIYQLSNLDIKTIEEIKAQLRLRNCFGYDRYEENIILHFRSNKKLMIDAYSYCLLKEPNSIPKFLESSFDFGKLNNTTYWFYNEIVGIISYKPWLVLYNRDIVPSK